MPANQFACELLVYLDDPQVVAKTMSLSAAASMQEEKLLWLYELRLARTGWTPALRRAYWKALEDADAFVGGSELPIVLFSIAAEFREGLTPAERGALGELPGQSASAAPLKPNRPKVREWRVEDLTTAGSKKPDLKRGRDVFAEALCIRCHRFEGRGKPIGPDLNAVGRRLGRRDLLESILIPSKVIDAKYAQTAFELRDGRVVVGRVVGGDDVSLLVAVNPASPLDATRIKLAEVERRSPSKISPMPAQLLDGFTAEEIHDLLGYLESH
jgi:putative heme-binding domain-containing protein